jgi:uncharacterized protein
MVVRRALALVLIASGLKLLNATNGQLLAALVIVGVAGPLLWMAARRTVGLPASWRTERRLAASPERSASPVST